MADPRMVLERELERVDIQPFTLGSFHTRRERKRRNQRMAAAALGLTVAIATAVVAIRALSPSPTDRDVGTAPTPSSSTVQLARFESRFYGYSVSYPEEWGVQRAAVRWTSGELNSGLADRFVDPIGPDRILLEIASIQIPEQMTVRQWLDREERRHARLAGFGSSCDQEHGVLPTEVDGVPGRFAVDCGLVTVVTQRRGYVIRLHEDVAIGLDLRAALESIELHPEEA